MSNSNNNNDAPTVKRNWLSICVTISVLCLIGVLLLIAKEKPLTPNPPEETPTAGSLDELTTNRIDGAEMILIPSGEFIMGSDFIDDEKPVRSVYLDDFYIYKTEVTVAQYSKFCTDTNKKMPEKPEYGWQYNYPIVNVSWENATAYAKWAGVSLPTEAQWEKAARGPNGLVYPWGNKWDSSKCSNYKNGETSEPSPVGSFPAGASFYGVLDMAGNVWEWCADWYGGEYYQIWVCT